MMRAVIAAAAGVCCLLAAIAIVRVWSSSGESVSLRDVDAAWAAASMSAMLAAITTYAVCWALLVSTLEPGRVKIGAAVQLFLMTWPGRYVPASLPHYGGRLAAGPRAGISRPAVAASLAYENLFGIAISGLLAVSLLALGLHHRIDASAWVVAAVACAGVALCALHPVIIRAAVRALGGRVKRLRVLEDHVLPAAAVARIGAAYGVGALLAGLSFYCAARAVTPAQHVPFGLTIAAYNIAGIAGMLAFAVPSGLGVREGVVVAMLGATLSAPVALAAALFVRLIAVAADFLPLMLVLAWHGGRRATRIDVRRPVEARGARPRW